MKKTLIAMFLTVTLCSVIVVVPPPPPNAPPVAPFNHGVNG